MFALAETSLQEALMPNIFGSPLDTELEEIFEGYREVCWKETKFIFNEEDLKKGRVKRVYLCSTCLGYHLTRGRS